jgi:hypothetical protein
VETYFDDLQAAAAELGLVVTISGGAAWRKLRASGRLEGQVVQVDASTGSDRDAVLMRCMLSPPLDLGLTVRRAMTTLLRGITIDAPGFDAEHHVQADEPARAQQLLDEDVCAAISAVADLGADVELTDALVTARQGGGFVEIEPTLRALVAVVAAVRARLPVVAPPAELLGAAVGWQALAEREGLAFTRCPLFMCGADVTAVVTRDSNGMFYATARVTPERPLEAGVAMKPARLLEPLWELFQGKDLQVGDAAFDRAFTIQARDPDVARALFTPEVRALLLELSYLGEVRLDDAGLELQRAEASHVPKAIHAMREVLERAWQAARLSGRVGAYR